MKLTLTDEDYVRAAHDLGCDPAMIRAVAEVESSGSGFTGTAPTILFERHVFYRNAPKDKRVQWAKDHPELCASRPYAKGGYGPKNKQYEKLREAAKLDYNAALMACSWGTFQELGENYKELGFASVRDFVEAMRQGADRHLDIFVRSIKWRGIADEMRSPSIANCRKIARAYNGPAYAKFDYHNKIWNKFKKYQGTVQAASQRADEMPEVSGGGATLPPVSPPSPETPPVQEQSKNTFDRIAEADAKFAIVDTAASRVSSSSWLVTLTTKVGGWLLLLWSLVTTHPEWSVLAIVLIVAAIWYLNSSKNRGAKRNADTDLSVQ